MAHKFESGLFFGKSAWHGLGVTLPEDSADRYSIEGSIVKSGLNWGVGLEPVTVAGKALPDYRAVVRDNGDVLGVVGKQYKPLQNREQFNWFAPFLESGECQFETCGSLKGGRLVWVLAKINRDDAEVGQGDTIKKYLLLTSSHDGSKATSVGFCPIRVVCWNTLSAGLKDRNSTLLKVKHTAKQHKALAAIRETVNLVNETFEATAAQYRKLAACNLDAAELRKYVKLVLQLPEDDKAITTRGGNILDGIIDLAANGVGNDGKTAWAAYNGVTHYVTHHYGRNADSRLRAAWYGEGKKLSDRAFELALQLAS